MKNKISMIASVAIFSVALGLSLQNALNGYGVKDGKMHPEVLAQTSTGGGTTNNYVIKTTGTITITGRWYESMCGCYCQSYTYVYSTTCLPNGNSACSSKNASGLGYSCD